MRIPHATYRVQLNTEFGFQDLRKIVGYLSDLGISDVYVSPIFKARDGSPHGYDIVDMNRINDELGEPDDLPALSRELRERSMGWLQDIVPNHMAFHHGNDMLMDILENGLSSRYATFFDIYWDDPHPLVTGRLLAPFLGRHFGQCLEAGEIVPAYGAHGFRIHYYTLQFALKIETYADVLGHRLGMLKVRMGEDDPNFVKLLGILYVLKTLPGEEDRDERYHQIRFVKRMLWELYTRDDRLRAFLDENIRIFNGTPGDPESFRLLEELLARQLFRLSFWKVAADEINYRRFFTINELISVRVESEEVFQETHRLLLELLARGMVSGFRVDHVDGLRDPTSYLRRLREKIPGVFIVVEKILDPDEALPIVWPVQGTTGYDFLSHVNGLFCRTENEDAFDRIYEAVTGFSGRYDDLVREKKTIIIDEDMSGDVYNLAQLIKGVAVSDRHGGDITLYRLHRALKEILSVFPVYRTYFGTDSYSATDRKYVKAAVAEALRRRPGLRYECAFIERFLLLDYPDYLSDDEKSKWLEVAMRFQQLTGPLMAKGFEDTTLYVYNRLVSLNDVGCEPRDFGYTLDAFDEFCINRQQLWPHSLNATATHDTKRGEDARARINVLSEIPREWEERVKRWMDLNQRGKERLGNEYAPDTNDEYLLYQSLIGAFPFHEDDFGAFVQRIKEYVVKAVREAKVHTAWLTPDERYENAFVAFVDTILGDADHNPFLEDFLPFQRRIAHHGMLNSLSQTLVKITAPGVPDFYQGSELWDFSLVDPDNRRPVSYDVRRTFIEDILLKDERGRSGLIKELMETYRDGRIKMFLIRAALLARRAHADLFQTGEYVPLRAGGVLRDHVMAFARHSHDRWAVTIVPRFTTSLVRDGRFPLGETVWGDTRIPVPGGMPAELEDAVCKRPVSTGGGLLVAESLKEFPVALLTGHC
ncbi:MAG: malto-oligosyltrehalose synthase [Desulfomonilaceae bacterium]|nr:malto-oligosyltrehalose synthase [Desulfomonilaceae bacterium]